MLFLSIKKVKTNWKLIKTKLIFLMVFKSLNMSNMQNYYVLKALMFLFLQAGWDKTIRQLAYESRPHLVHNNKVVPLPWKNSYMQQIQNFAIWEVLMNIIGRVLITAVTINTCPQRLFSLVQTCSLVDVNQQLP